MAIETPLRYSLRRLTEAFRRYALTQHWGPDDYQVFVRLNLDWGAIHLILVAKEFRSPDGGDPWASVDRFLEDDLKDDRALYESLRLVLHTYDQVKEGGLYGIPRSYEDIKYLLNGGLASPP
jgi:hypothetical protein